MSITTGSSVAPPPASLAPDLLRVWIGRLGRLPGLCPHWPALILVPAATLMFFWRLGEGTLADWDEAVYAQVSKEMLRSGDWLVPSWNFAPFYDKPPLYMWLTAGLYAFLGVGEFSARAVSAVAGVALVATTYAIGRRLYDTSTGLLAGLVLLTTAGIVSQARFGTLDVLLTLWVYLGVYAYLRIRCDQQGWWYGLSTCFALACLTKGPAALVPFGGIAVDLLLTGSVSTVLRSRSFWRGVVLAGVLVLPWHLYMVVRGGQEFLTGYIGVNLVGRVTSVVDDVHTGDASFYIGTMTRRFSPWYFLLPATLVIGVHRVWARKSGARVLLILALVLMLTFSLARTKIPWYIVPIYPALAVLIAGALRSAFAAPRSLATLALAFSGLFPVLERVLGVAPAGALVAALLVVSLGAMVSISLVRHELVLRGLLASLTLCLLVAELPRLGSYLNPRQRPTETLARMARSTEPLDREPLIVYSGLSGPTPLFYSDRRVLEPEDESELDDLLQGQSSARILLGQDDFDELSRGYAAEVVGRAGPLVYAIVRQVASGGLGTGPDNPDQGAIVRTPR